MELHEQQIKSLKTHSFDKLIIKRYKKICYLIISIDEDAHVLLNPNGKKKVYRHAWQIKEWLLESFGIKGEMIGFEDTTIEK